MTVYEKVLSIAIMAPFTGKQGDHLVDKNNIAAALFIISLNIF